MYSCVYARPGWDKRDSTGNSESAKTEKYTQANHRSLRRRNMRKLAQCSMKSFGRKNKNA